MKKILVYSFLTFTLIFSQKIIAQNKADLVDQIKTDLSWCDGMLVERHVTINADKNCWALLLDKTLTNQGAKYYKVAGYSIAYFAKHMGWGDLTEKDGYDYGDKEKQEVMAQIADAFKGKISFTLDAAAMPSTKLNYQLMMRYTSTIFDFVKDPAHQSGIENWKPKGGEMHLKLAMSNKVKDIVVTTDGKNFTVTAPFLSEPDGWDSKIKKGLTKGGN